MQPIDDRRPGNAGSIAVRVLAGIVATVCGLVFLLAAWVFVSSRFGGASQDVHGYGVIFGAVLMIAAGVLVALALPLAFPRARWFRMYRISFGVYVLVFIATVVMLVTA